MSNSTPTQPQNESSISSEDVIHPQVIAACALLVRSIMETFCVTPALHTRAPLHIVIEPALSFEQFKFMIHSLTHLGEAPLEYVTDEQVALDLFTVLKCGWEGAA